MNEFKAVLNMEATPEELKADTKLQQPDNYMGVIPWQLQDESFRFTGILPEGVMVKGVPSDGKHPAHRWKDEPLCYNSLKMQKHLKKHPAYAVVCGHGNLVVLDVDDEQGKAVTEELPETFIALSANKKLPHIYFKVNTDEQLYERYRYVPMTEAEEVEWVENFKAKADNKLILKPMIEVKGLGTILNGANSRIAEGKSYESVTSVPIAEVTLEQLRDALWRFGVSWEQQYQKLMARLLSSRPDTYEEHHSTPKQKEQVFYGESGQWYDHPLWLEIMESVTMKEAYVTQGGRFAPPRHQCLFCGSRSSVELKDGGYRCYNPACKVYHKNSWFLYQAVEMQLNASNYDWKKCTLKFAKLAGTSYRKRWEAFLKNLKVKQDNKAKQRGNSDAETKLHQFNMDHFIAPIGGRAKYCYETTNEYGEPILEMYDERDFHILDATRMVYVDGKDKPLTYVWKTWADRRQYRGITFKPIGIGKNDTVEGFYNQWQGFSVEPRAGKCDRILFHLKEVLCSGNEEHFEYLMTWFAHMVQKPEDKPGVAIVVKGKKGTGKSIVTERIWQKILGDHYAQFSKSEEVTGRFNAHHRNKLLMVLEEAVWAGDKQAEGTLKSLITDKKQTIEAKGVDAGISHSYCRLYFNTNERRAVPATLDERRYFILRTSSEYADNKKYFAALISEIDNGGVEAFLEILKNYKVEDLAVRMPPKTAALLEDVEEGMPPLERWLFDLSCEHRHEVVDGLSGERRVFTWDDRVTTELFFEHFKQWIRVAQQTKSYIEFSGIPSRTIFSREVKQLLGLRRTKIDSKNAFILPSQDVARAKLLGEFAKYGDFEAGDSVYEEIFDGFKPTGTYKVADPVEYKDDMVKELEAVTFWEQNKPINIDDENNILISTSQWDG